VIAHHDKVTRIGGLSCDPIDADVGVGGIIHHAVVIIDEVAGDIWVSISLLPSSTSSSFTKACSGRRLISF
jgi:hypothetical protein